MSDPSIGRSDLTQVSTSTLERLRDGIEAERIRAPISRAVLLSHGIQNQLQAIESALGGHSRLACVSILDAALAERMHRVRPVPELVWTGPEHSHATARDTAVVLRALFESADREVILAGFSFKRGSGVLEPLYRAMSARALSVRFFIYIEQAERALPNPDAYASEQIAAFFKECWPFGDPKPQMYYDQRALVPGPPWSSLHAKCVVVDRERAFVSSANFSNRAQEHNIEAGVLLHDRAFAGHLAAQWLGLIDAGLVRAG